MTQSPARIILVLLMSTTAFAQSSVTAPATEPASSSVATNVCMPFMLPSGAFVPSALCQAQSGSTYVVGAHLLVEGNTLAEGAYLTHQVQVGRFADGNGVLMRDGAIGVTGGIARRRDFRSLTAAWLFSESLFGEDRVFLTGEASTASDGTAVITFDDEFLEEANTDRDRGGGYIVLLTANGPDSVWIARDDKQPGRFIVRSAPGRSAPFTYLVIATLHGGEARLSGPTRIAPQGMRVK